MSTPRQPRGLTERQRRFVQAYSVTANGADSARRAGYTGDDQALAVTGSKLLRNPKVAQVLAAIGRKKNREEIATRDRRLVVLSQIVEGRHGAKPSDRVQAAKLIAAMSGELVHVQPVDVTAKVDVNANVSTRQVHVVLTMPPSPHVPPPPAELTSDPATRSGDA